jgi:hypothetical protein
MKILRIIIFLISLPISLSHFLISAAASRIIAILFAAPDSIAELEANNIVSVKPIPLQRIYNYG